MAASTPEGARSRSAEGRQPRLQPAHARVACGRRSSSVIRVGSHSMQPPDRRTRFRGSPRWKKSPRCVHFPAPPSPHIDGQEVASDKLSVPPCRFRRSLSMSLAIGSELMPRTASTVMALFAHPVPGSASDIEATAATAPSSIASAAPRYGDLSQDPDRPRSRTIRGVASGRSSRVNTVAIVTWHN